MADYRTMFDREYIGAWDITGRDATVTIAKVEAKRLKSARGDDLKPILHFEGKEKGFVCNKTNAKTIAGMYGNDTAKWIGKAITLFATTTSAGGETVECIRIRPQIPRAANGRKRTDPEPASDLNVNPDANADWGITGTGDAS